ncbi:MAG: sulfatase [Lentisphaerae bacterium]|nr:sulfatase [Lentisphaerota bacterium]
MRRPNIFMIVVHDLGTHLACYRNDRSIPTPNLDRLAGEGVRFDNHFCAAPFCSPSRGAIITGKYPHVNGLMGLVNLGWDIPSGQLRLAQALKLSGYDTFLFGHQHESKDPGALGFDAIDISSQKGSGVAPLVREFVKKKSVGEPSPFYCQIGFTEVHRTVRVFNHESELKLNFDELTPLPYLKDTAGLREDLRDFYGTIQDMDLAVGAILESIDHSPLKNDTLVVFTTDHGIAFPRAKGTLYDAGINTCLIMRWPNGFAGGRISKELLSNVDIFPTLLDVAGAPIPGDISGHSFLGLLQETGYVPNQRIFAEMNTMPGDVKRCVRTERYKLIRNFDEGPALTMPAGSRLSPTGLMMGDDHLVPRPKLELYDISEDPYEQNNLVSTPEYKAIENELTAELQYFLETTNDPILSGNIPRPAEEEEILRQYAIQCEEHLKASV